MRVGLIADTHVPHSSWKLPQQVAQALAGVDLILHAGDISVSATLDWLEELAPVMAARGNNDFMVKDDPRVKDSLVLDLGGLRVGVVHIIEYPVASWRALEESMESSFGGPVDVIVFGDTHVSLVETYHGVLMVNPGSPNLPEDFRRPGSVGFLDIEAGRAQASIMEIKGEGPGPVWRFQE